MRVTVYVRDSDLTLRGPLPVTAGTAVLRDSAVGAWSFDMDARDAKAARLVPGAGVYVVDAETSGVLFSGPMTSRQVHAPGDGTRILTVSGVTDEVHLADRITLPDPTKADTAQSTGLIAHYTRSGAAETVARALVDSQAGPGALLSRRVAGLILEPDLARGGLVEVNVRYSPHVADVLGELASTGGISWRVVQSGRSLVFRVATPKDLSRRVRFSRATQNLGEFTVSKTAPDVTDVTVLAQGDLAARTIRHRATTNTAALAWGRRIEAPLDRRDTDTNTVLDNAGDEALTEGAATSEITFDALDLPRRRYGRDYNLGDIGTVELDDGVFITDRVRQATLTWEPEGVRTKALIGPAAARDPNQPPSVRAIRQLRKRLGRLESVK